MFSLAVTLFLLVPGCAPLRQATETIAREAERARRMGNLPLTRAERTAYRETSRYRDVVQFLDSLQRMGAPIHVGSIGRSGEGREIPYVIASRPLVATPQQARRMGRPVVYVQANIHGGEVEGKEVLQALVRDLAFAEESNALDSLVLLAVPIYNVDGNERFGPQERMRGEQNGPEVVGARANADGLDLNRDYVKAEAPETRAALAFFERWDPDLFVDLHTTNGSFHGYGLTYAPSLSPAARRAGSYARDSLLPTLRLRLRPAVETFDYGNFSLTYGADVGTDTTKEGWFSYDHRPRFGTNYYGLRGRIAILGEAYSHDPFERRVAATRAFVAGLLSLVAERRREIVGLSDALDRELTEGARAGAPLRVPIRAELTRTPQVGEVIAEDLASTGDSSVTEPGMPPGLRRTGRFRTLRIPVHDRFTPTRTVDAPVAYAFESSETEMLRRLRAHGVRVERLTRPWRAEVATFIPDSVIVAPQPFQGHATVRLEGRWRETRRTLPEGTLVVPVAQPLGVLAVYLLEPESDDGMVTWNALARTPTRGEAFPVLRITGALTAARRTEP